MKKLFKDPVEIGSKLLPLERDVAPASTQTVAELLKSAEIEVDPESMVILMCLVTGLLNYTLSEDAAYLATSDAKALSESLGVDKDKFMTLARKMEEIRLKLKKSNPLGSLF